MAVPKWVDEDVLACVRAGRRALAEAGIAPELIAAHASLQEAYWETLQTERLVDLHEFERKHAKIRRILDQYRVLGTDVPPGQPRANAPRQRRLRSITSIRPLVRCGAPAPAEGAPERARARGVA